MALPVVGWVLSVVSSFLAGFATAKVKKAVASVIGTAGVLSWHGFWKAAPTWGEAITKGILNTFLAPTKEWVTIATTTLEAITGVKATIPPEQLKEMSVLARQTAVQLGSAFLQPILDLVAPEKPVSPDMGKSNAEAYISLNMYFQMQSWILHLLQDVFGLGYFKSVGALPNAISWAYGLGWLSWLVLGVPFRKAIADPLEIYYNRVYQQARLDKSELVEAYHKGIIDLATCKEALQDYGYNINQAEALIRLKQKLPSETLLKSMLEYNLIEEEEAINILKAHGYTEFTAKFIARRWLLEEIRKYDMKIVSEAVDAYIENEITEDDLTSILRTLDVNPLIFPAILDYANFKKARPKHLTTGQILKAFKKGIYDYEAALVRLTKMGYTTEDADVLLQLYEEVEAQA